jgi:hypothetical protein
MPLRSAWLYARGERDVRYLALMVRQIIMSVAIMAAVWLTGVMAGLWPTTTTATVVGRSVHVPAVLMIAPVVLTFGTLFAVLITVELLRLIVGKAPSPGRTEDAVEA